MNSLSSNNNTPKTKDGLNFIRNSTAVPDFTNSLPTGIPDMYGGPAVMKADYLTQSITCAAGNDTYFVFMPTPSVAYWTQSLPIGTVDFSLTTWQAITFPDIRSIYPNIDDTPSALGPPISSTQQVVRFRYATLAGELQCCMNETQWSGNIVAWRTPLTLVVDQGTLGVTAPLEFTLNGFDGIATNGLSFSQGANSAVFSTPLRDGVYSQAMCMDNDFPFVDIRDNVVRNSTCIAPYEQNNGITTSTNAQTIFKGPMFGMGTMESIIFRVQVPVGAANQSFLIKSWSSIEYQPAHSSLLHQFAQPSPPYDPGALMMYKNLTDNLPIGVTQAQNANFWDTVLNVGRGIANIVKHVPGPIGLIGQGVEQLIPKKKKKTSKAVKPAASPAAAAVASTRLVRIKPKGKNRQLVSVKKPIRMRR